MDSEEIPKPEPADPPEAQLPAEQADSSLSDLLRPGGEPPSPVPEDKDIALAELKIALEQFRHHSVLRRTGLAFVVTVYLAVAHFVGSCLAEGSGVFFAAALSFFAVFVGLMGRNNELRLTDYMHSWGRRARTIEVKLGMYVMRDSLDDVRKYGTSRSNVGVFPMFYRLTAAAWLGLAFYLLGTLVFGLL